MCLGGNSANTDRKKTLEAYGDMSSIISKQAKTGDVLTSAGTSETGQAADYFRKIMAGDVSAIAPEVKAITGEADAKKKELGTEGTARGGGVNAASQKLDTDTRGQIADVINKGRTGAAGATAKIGAEETGKGIESTGNAGTGAANLASISGENRKTSQAIHDQAVTDWANAVASVFTAAGA